MGHGERSHFQTPEDLYRHKYIEAIDLTTESIRTRFDQPGHSVYRNLEDDLVMAANGKSFDKPLEAIREFYGDYFDWTSLSAQLESLSVYFAQEHSISLKDCI